jgi:hypothetical protein
MADPTGFFCFTHKAQPSSGDEQTYVFAYKPPGPIAAGVLDELMLAVCRGPMLPDAVVVLGLIEEKPKTDLLSELRKESAQIAQQRLAGRIPLIFASLELKTGKTRISLLDHGFKSRIKTFQNVIEQSVNNWLQSGLRAIFDAKEIVLKAPSGYAYQKPSGARSEIFLKPDLALRSSAVVGFVALALFVKLFSGRLRQLEDLQTIFVDTMAISPVAYGLRELFELFGKQQPFNIESFHSYGGFEAVRMPLRGTSLCMISASSSMSLHEQWVAKKSGTDEEVITLVTLEAAEKYKDRALLVIEVAGQGVSSGPAQLSIRIQGETFLPAQDVSKKILLTDVHHRSDHDVAHFCAFAGEKVFDIYRRPSTGNSKPRALYVDGNRLIQLPRFGEWLNERLLHSVKAATKVIVYQNDKESESLANQINGVCKTILNSKGIKVISAAELPQETLPGDAGVIVCAAVIGKGSRLLEISRTLRDKHVGPRLYVIGYQISETLAELSNIDSNLKHSKTVAYEVAKFGQAAIGTQLGASFAAEVDTYYQQSKNLRSLPKPVWVRGEALGTTKELNRQALLPHGARLDGQLSLRVGFAYWPNSYALQSCQPELLATMAVLLQRARESKALVDERRLASGSFQHVVLAPENFTRFNDGLIQAALLRCAYPSELDYRDDQSASDFMKALILRSLDRAAQESGEAILEFLLALRQKRLMLTDPHLAEIAGAVAKSTSKNSILNKAIAYVFEPTTASSAVKRKLPF